MKNPKFVELLISKAIIPEAEIKDLEKKYENDSFSLLIELKDKNPDRKEELGRLWGDSLKFSYVNLAKTVFQDDILALISPEVALENKIIPIYKFGDVLTIATSQPQNKEVLDNLEKLVDQQLSPVFSFDDEIEEAIQTKYSMKISLKELARKMLMNTFFVDKSFNIAYKILSDENVVNTSLTKIMSELSKKKIIFTEEIHKRWLDSSKKFFDQVAEGNIPASSECENIVDSIIKEISENKDKISSIHYIRINNDFTYSHPINTAMFSIILAQSMDISYDEIRNLALGAFLHDVGLFKLPRKILSKLSDINKEEIEIVKTHTKLGYELITDMGFPVNIAEIALNHHERFDEKGYPNNLERNKISLNSQIVSLSDVYDILLSIFTTDKEIIYVKAFNVLLSERYKAFAPDIFLKFAKTIIDRDAFNSIRSLPDDHMLKNLIKQSIFGECLGDI